MSNTKYILLHSLLYNERKRKNLSFYLLIPPLVLFVMVFSSLMEWRGKIHLKYDGILSNFHATFPFNFFLSFAFLLVHVCNVVRRKITFVDWKRLVWAQKSNSNIIFSYEMSRVVRLGMWCQHNSHKFTDFEFIYTKLYMCNRSMKRSRRRCL